jgi:putative hemolysin
MILADSSNQVEPQSLKLFASAKSELTRTLGFGVPGPLLKWITGFDQTDDLWRRAHATAGASIFDCLLSALGVEYRCSPSDLERIPSQGPVVLVSNHPFGLLDGLILSSLTHRRRKDFRVLANSILASIPEVNEYIIAVSVIAREVKSNGSALRSALRWLHSGGALIIFPAGEVSSPHGMPPAIVDPEWNQRILQLAPAAKSRVVPVHVSGRNSTAFQCAGLVHPMLRTALLNRELMNKRGQVVDVAVGHPISPASIQKFGGQELTGYVRTRTYLLGERRATFQASWLRRNPAIEPIADPVAPDALARDIRALPESALLLRGGGQAVYLAQARQIPAILREIGRLREVTFRSAGEGTGHSLDLDSFDEHYEHLFVWSERKSELVGAYRLARVDKTLERFGPRGLYTHRLFQLKPHFLHQFADGLELGRSFVRQEYQRSLHPLYYLWKGIGAYLRRNPSCRYLFGPVSISGDYSRAARELMVQYFRRRRANRIETVRARKPFRARRLGARFLSGLARHIGDVDELSDFIADLEPDGKGIPVLLRHYLGLGAEVLEFNLDSEFANALDALIVVDLTRSNPAMLKKYLGEEGLRQYLAFQQPHMSDLGTPPAI